MKRATITLLSLLCFILCLVACNDDNLRTTPQSSAKTILSFDITGLNPKAAIKLDTIERIIKVTLPALTDPKSLIPEITVSKKATISPASGVPQDFDKEIIYTVTAEDGTSHNYRVVTAIAESSKKDIISFKFSALTPEAVGIIDTTTRIIYVKVPAKTDVTKLTPTIGVSEKATVSPESGVEKNFSQAVTYTVTAQNGTTRAYSVRVSIPISVNALTKTTYLNNDLVTIQGTNFLNPLSQNTITFVNTKTGVKTIITNTTGNTTVFLFAIPNSMLPGTYKIVITTTDKQEITLPETITVNAPSNAPKITSVSQTELKPNDVFTINGQNFSTTLSQNSIFLVRSDGTEERLIPKTATATQMTVTVPTDVKLGTFAGLRVEVLNRGTALYSAVFTTAK